MSAATEDDAAMTRTGRPPGKSRGCDCLSTPERILLTAADLFDELGYHEANLRRIADKAGVDHALIVRYFAGKAQLFIRCVETALDEAADWTPGEQSPAHQKAARLVLAAAYAPMEVKRAVSQAMAQRAAASDQNEPLDVRMGAVVCAELAQTLLLAAHVDDPEFKQMARRMYAGLDAPSLVSNR